MHSTVHKVVKYSFVEGGIWYEVLGIINIIRSPLNPLDKQLLMNLIGIPKLAAIQVEGGYVYDFILGGWRDLYERGLYKSIDKPSNPKDIVGTSKAPLSTVSSPVLAELGVAMLEGALKYGRHNYRAVGVRASIYYDATLRHLFSWWEGEDIDPDSGMNHITKAIASLCVLRDAMIQQKIEDDRPPKSKEFYKELNQKVEALQKRYEDRSPTHYTQHNISQTTKEL